MPIRETKCAFCNISVKNQKKLCESASGQPSKCIKIHSKKVKEGSIQYRCTNYKGHGWTKESKHNKSWFYVTFYDKPTLDNKRYLYQSSILHDSESFIKEHQGLAREGFDDEVIKSIRALNNTHALKVFFKSYFPELLELNRSHITVPESISIHDLQILFCHLKGFSIDLIIEVVHATCRAYVRNVIKEFMSESKINVKKFSLNCSFTYHPSKHKIIESRYYNKYRDSDFYYIN